MSLDEIMDACFKCLLIVFSAGLTLLVPFWVWFMLRLYVPKKQPPALRASREGD